jgi:dipeptidyl aminopeptidase/acylaminoacyl peptidase
VQSREWEVTVLAALLLLPGLIKATLNGRRTEPLPVECALRTHSFSELSPIAFSRDGKWVAYMVRTNERARPKEVREIEREHYVRTGMFTQNQAGDIWISNIETGESKMLTNARSSNWDPSWSPDGRYLGFLSDRDGSGQARAWVWDSTNDQVKSVTTVNVRISYPSAGIQWTPDSQNVLLTIVPERLSLDEYIHQVLSPDSIVEQPAGKRDETTVRVYVGVPSRGDTEGARSSRYNLDAYSRADLALINVRTGAIRTIAHGRRIGWYAVSPDGSRVAYSIPTKLHPEGRFRKVFDLASFDLSRNEEHLLVSSALMTEAFAWSPDSSLLTYGIYDSSGTTFFSIGVDGGQPNPLAKLPHAVGSFEVPVWDAAGKHFYLLADGALWRVSLSGSAAEEVARIPERQIVRRIAEPSGTLWSTDGGKSTVVLTRDDLAKQNGFYKVDLATGASTRLLEEGHCYDCNFLGSGLGLGMMAAAGRYVAYIAENAQQPPDLWVSDADFRSPRQVTRLNPQMEDYAMGLPRLIDWLSEDGRHLQGALLLPPNYRQGVPYPLLVYVYPTTLSNELDHFAFGEFPGPLNLQLLATRGYAVLLPDVREEREYGMSSIAKSVMPGITKLVELGIVDPERIGIMGHSGGGYATLALLVETDRFKAALEASGFADYIGMYGQMDRDGIAWPADEIGRSLGGPPWQFPFSYLSNSPIFYLDRIKTPLLIVHGTEDEAVSSSLGNQLFVGMRSLGKEVQYAQYDGESHVLRDWSYANQVDLCRRMLGWFESHLKYRAPRTDPQ